jgi:peptidoglycan/xylan/chitin deacetylase (PgdA/CDA1 family)
MRLSWSRRAATGNAVVLLYHRIAAPVEDPWGNCVRPERFAQHLKVIRSSFGPLSLGELARGLRDGAVPPRSICVTFDDGYADNLYAAKPLLERYEVPATVFVVSGYVDSGRDFWWDELEQICFNSSLPSHIRIATAGHPLEWSRTGRGGQSWRGWRAWRKPRTDRQRLYALLYPELRAMTREERSRILAELRGLSGAVPAEPLTSNVDEIRQLAEAPLIEIGAHSVEHPVLTTLDPAQQRDEIVGSKVSLENMLGQTIQSFAYPYSQYDERTVAGVRAAGFLCAGAGSQTETVTASTDPYALPRLPVQDWAGGELARRLSTMLRS